MGGPSESAADAVPRAHGMRTVATSVGRTVRALRAHRRRPVPAGAVCGRTCAGWRLEGLRAGTVGVVGMDGMDGMDAPCSVVGAEKVGQASETIACLSIHWSAVGGGRPVSNASRAPGGNCRMRRSCRASPSLGGSAPDAPGPRAGTESREMFTW